MVNGQQTVWSSGQDENFRERGRLADVGWGGVGNGDGDGGVDGE